ncbi:lipoprotein-releasing system transmembrane subunit LolC [Deltaproteobacteria bacterium Smac51]|nr:lipoprotein-releasing system transmembrane subunit LolC [Deltaproteobacteria bacterium Smac51]
MSIESNIAFRYMKARRKENFISLITVISVAGVGLGVAALIVVLAVLAGFESNLKEKFLGITSHVVLMRIGGGIENWAEEVEKVRQVPGVKHAEPFVYGQALATGPGGPSGLMIKGIDPDMAAAGGQLSNMSASPGALEFLKAPDNFDEPPIILGRELSYQLNVYQYDEISVISPFGRITPLGSRAPLTRAFQVAGTFHSGLYEYDSSMAYLSIPEAQSLMAMENDEVSTIELMVDDIYKADQIKQAALEVLGEGFWGRDWMQMNINLFAALKLEQAAMFVVLTLTIVVAAFNIVATLIMMVTEKKRDIAILKSMGASKKQIRRIFTIQGLSVGLVGAVGGLLVGVTLCVLLKQYKFITLPPDIYMMDSLPIEMRGIHIFLTVTVTIAISYLATIYPARQASRLDPAEALRYE